MDKKTVLVQLEKVIPSFQRKWTGFGGTCDENNKYGFLYKDEFCYNKEKDGSVLTKELPFFIPKGFLEGIVVEKDDKSDKLISLPPIKQEGKLVIGMQVTSFQGYGLYEHTYGTLQIPGPRWSKVGTNSIICGYLGDYTSDPNFDPRIQSIWNVELCRIITEEDINSRADWHGWKPGDANQRFVSISEMFLTACYITLARIETPFILKGDERYYSDREKWLISTDDNDEVTFYDFFYDNITSDNYSLFK